MEFLIIAVAFVVFRYQLALVQTAQAGQTATLAPRKSAVKVAQLSDYADRLYNEKKWLAAEKAYLSVLKIDHKNVTAYSHLGVIYSTQKNIADAIECFKIAARLRPSGGTFQNLGLAFYDNRNYIKAIAAYEKAIMFEPTAARYVGVGKAQRKLANLAAAVTAYEQATALDASPKLTAQLAELKAEAGTKSA